MQFPSISLFILVSMTTVKIYSDPTANGSNIDPSSLEFLGQGRNSVPPGARAVADPGDVINTGSIDNQMIYNVDRPSFTGKPINETGGGGEGDQTGGGKDPGYYDSTPSNNFPSTSTQGPSVNPPWSTQVPTQPPNSGGWGGDPNNPGGQYQQPGQPGSPGTPFVDGQNPSHGGGGGQHPFGGGGGQTPYGGGGGQHPFGGGGGQTPYGGGGGQPPSGGGQSPFGGGGGQNPIGGGGGQPPFGGGGQNPFGGGGGQNPIGGGGGQPPFGGGGQPPFGGGGGQPPFGGGGGQPPFGGGGGQNPFGGGGGQNPFGGGGGQNPFGGGGGQNPFGGGGGQNPSGGGGGQSTTTGPFSPNEMYPNAEGFGGVNTTGMTGGIVNAGDMDKQVIVNIENKLVPQFNLHFDSNGNLVGVKESACLNFDSSKCKYIDEDDKSSEVLAKDDTITGTTTRKPSYRKPTSPYTKGPGSYGTKKYKKPSKSYLPKPTEPSNLIYDDSKPKKALLEECYKQCEVKYLTCKKK